MSAHKKDRGLDGKGYQVQCLWRQLILSEGFGRKVRTFSGEEWNVYFLITGYFTVNFLQTVNLDKVLVSIKMLSWLFNFGVRKVLWIFRFYASSFKNSTCLFIKESVIQEINFMPFEWTRNWNFEENWFWKEKIVSENFSDKSRLVIQLSCNKFIRVEIMCDSAMSLIQLQRTGRPIESHSSTHFLCRNSFLTIKNNWN